MEILGEFGVKKANFREFSPQMAIFREFRPKNGKISCIFG
jgi:hypothetical protein